jgi:hypothetical protein
MQIDHVIYIPEAPKINTKDWTDAEMWTMPQESFVTQVGSTRQQLSEGLQEHLLGCILLAWGEYAGGRSLLAKGDGEGQAKARRMAYNALVKHKI